MSVNLTEPGVPERAKPRRDNGRYHDPANQHCEFKPDGSGGDPADWCSCPLPGVPEREGLETQNYRAGEPWPIQVAVLSDAVAGDWRRDIEFVIAALSHLQEKGTDG